ncbi:hypothetical protein [Micromonospora sp. NRRL B-16802]|uniref:hypothetical protein n=1 Tax=Micromonospora sp. NRRL B-16802 TaxID=1415541 RepID=UPI001E30955C|nr:hypothetical protein [Micromonospora sp. NRRL B-16802]
MAAISQPTHGAQITYSPEPCHHPEEHGDYTGLGHVEPPKWRDVNGEQVSEGGHPC